MDLSEPSFHRLLDLVYDAAEHPDRWQALYREMQVALGVKSIHVLGLDKRHGTLSYSDGANLPVEGELAYMQRYRLEDPRLAMIAAKPVGEWTHCDEELTQAMIDTLPVYQELLLPYDRRHVSGCKLVDTPDATIIFSTLSGAAEGPLQPDAVAFLDRLLPHLRRAIRIGLRNFVYSTQALVGHLLVNKLRQPVILSSPEGEVVHTNEAAQELLRSTSLVRIENGQLRMPEPHLQALLRRCEELEQSLKVLDGDDAAASAISSDFRSLHITEPARRESIYAFFTVMTPRGAMGTFGLRPVVMLLFYDPASAPVIDASLLYAVFGLTPAEARIATLLADGLSLKQIAEVQGTQHDTVRKQLRSIYEKTSTNRQPELIRLLLHLPHNAVQR
jgi:DNA-binding CsgD family transcriptional regulator